MFSQVFIFSQWSIFDPMSFLQMGISCTRSSVGGGYVQAWICPGGWYVQEWGGYVQRRGGYPSHPLGYRGMCQHVGSTHPTGILSCNKSSVVQHNEISKDSNGLVHIANLNL